MTPTLPTLPQFCQGQTVTFVGGAGTIKNCRPESNDWTYLVEMELGAQPDFGRVGAETMVWLSESDVNLLR
jgi:streptogramin lyase